MPKEAIPPLIALLGVMLSIAVSLLTSRMVFKNEARKLILEARKAYDSKLVEARLNAYPGLYLLISKFAKQIRHEHISRNDIDSFLREIDEWDSRNAILLSARTGHLCGRLRESLEAWLRADITTRPDVSTLQDLIQKIGILELALKSDLGIFGVEDAGLDTKVVDSYNEIWRKYKDEASR
jgi:hypothetical protein